MRKSLKVLVLFSLVTTHLVAAKEKDVTELTEEEIFLDLPENDLDAPKTRSAMVKVFLGKHSYKLLIGTGVLLASIYLLGTQKTGAKAQSKGGTLGDGENRQEMGAITGMLAKYGRRMLSRGSESSIATFKSWEERTGYDTSDGAAMKGESSDG